MADYSKAIVAAPIEKIDRVLLTDTVTFTVPAGAAGTVYTETIVLEGNGYGVCVGIYTSDGGTTYNDLAKLFPGGHAGYATSNQMLPDVTCDAYVAQVNSTNITFRFTRNVALGSARQVQVSYALLTLPDQDMDIPSSGYKRSNKAAYATDEGTYLKIADERGIFDSASYTIAHGLGYVPMVAYILYNFTYGFQMGAVYYDPNFTDGDMVKMDSTNVYIQIGFSFSAKIKVYLEQ